MFAENTYEVRDMVTHTWGAHTLRIGAEVRFEQDNDNLSGDARPVYAMQGLWSMVNDAPIYEAIDANPNNGGIALSAAIFPRQDIAIYAQHDWKVTPCFTLNTGLRWEDFTPLITRDSNQLPRSRTHWLGACGMMLVPHNNLWNSYTNNWGPKIGFAFQPGGDPKVVLRGGFAMAYNHLDVALFNNALEDGPNIANYGLCCGTNALDFGTPFARVDQVTNVESSNSPYSYPRIRRWLPVSMQLVSPTLMVAERRVLRSMARWPSTRPPTSYLYSLEGEYQMPWNFTATWVMQAAKVITMRDS